MSVDYVGSFERWAKARGVATRCEICSSDAGWAVYTAQDVHTVLPSGKDSDLYIGPYGIDAIAMRCKNCGNIRLFDLKAVLGTIPNVIEVGPLEEGK